MQCIRPLRLVFIFFVLFSLAACGGGGNKGGGNKADSGAKIILKGKVQKGIFSQLTVTAYLMDNQTGALSSPVETTSTDSTYVLELSEEGVYQLQATGTFTDETTGQDATLDEPLLAVVEVQSATDATTGAASAQTEVESNINLYTYMAALQVTSNVASGDTVTEALPAAENFVQQAVGLAADVDLSALDITAITADSSLNDPNLQLLLFSANVLQNSSIDVIDSVVADFGTYSTPDEASLGLSVLGGASAASLYEIIQPYLQDAPQTLTVLETDAPVYVCIQNCGWQVYTAPAMSIAGANVLESDAKIKLTISLSRKIDKDIQVLLRSVSVNNVGNNAVNNAVKGIDYKPTSQIITLPANQLSVDLLTSVILDTSEESAEFIRYELSAIGSDYIFAQQFRDIRIIDGYGNAQPIADNQVEIASLCLSAIGDGLNIQNEGCLNNATTGLPALPAKDTAALAIDLSLKFICDLNDGLCLQAARHDWLVEFSLEAFSEKFNTVVDSRRLGYYWFPEKKLFKTGRPAVIDTAYAHLDSQAFSLMDKADAENLLLRISARLVETSTQTLVSSQITQPLRLPEKIIAGDQAVDYVLNSMSQTAACNGDNYLIDAQYSVDDIIYNNAALCVAISVGQNGEIKGALQANQRLDLAGTRLALPAFHSSHVVYDDAIGNRLQVLGANYLILPFAGDNGAAASQILCDDINCYQGQGLAPSRPINDLSTYLHAEGLPFAFKITSGYLDNNGIHLNYSARKYLQAGEFSGYDPRSDDVPTAVALATQNALESNDIFYKQSGSGVIDLDSSGIAASITVAAGSGIYAFPEAKVDWEGFSYNIENSRISALNTIPLSFVLKQSPRCKGCDAALDVTYQLQGDLSVDANGTALGQLISQADTTPTWGQISGEKAFQRPGDLSTGATAMVSLPGYIFDLPETVGIDTLLMSHVENNSNNLIRHPLTSAVAIEGNEWPIGITLGPQTYFNAAGAPVAGAGRFLDDSNLRINNGVDSFNKPVNIGAKYVARNSGITGVFNLDIKPSVGDAMVMFGYDMNFSRFAFRLTDNTLDEYSWIDGRVSLPGDGDFDTEFTSLSLACDAKLGRGMVTYCDKPDCQQSLSAWQADTDIINMAFIGENGAEAQACVAENQQLSLEQTVEMYALTDGKGAIKPVGLIDVLWKPTGIIKSNGLAPFQDMILDAKDDKRGFSIAPGSGGLRVMAINNESYGVLELNKTELVASQFWNMMRTDIRLSNASLGAEQSVVVAAGELNKINIQKNDPLASNLISGKDNSGNDYKIFSPKARFTWNNSSFGFSLPVYYASGSTKDQASFFGRYQKADLLVMKAGAGIDYIQPTRTRLSFGASANIPKLGSLPIRIDFSDLNSLRNMDGLLDDFGINLSLEDTFTRVFPLQPYIERILKLGNNGLSYAIEETLDEILTLSAEVSINGVKVNLWEEIAEPIVALQSVPLQLDAVFDASISQSFERDVFQRSLNLREEFKTLSLYLDAAKDISIKNGTATVPIILSLESIRTELQKMKEATAKVSTEINTVRDQALDLVNTADSRMSRQIERLKSAIHKVSDPVIGILQQAIAINDQLACTSGNLTVDKADFLKPNIQLIKDVAEVIDLLVSSGETASNIVDIVSLLYMGESELMQEFRRAVERIQPDIRLVKSDFSDGLNSLYDAICNNSEDDYLQQALDDFEKLHGQVDAIVASLEELQQTIRDQATQAIGATVIVSVYIDSLNNILNNIEQQLVNPVEEFNIGVLRDEINNAISAISIPQIPGTFFDDLKIDVLFNSDINLEGGGELDFHSGVIKPIYLQLEAIPKNIRDSMQDITLAGAYFSADEYKAMVIESIMSSRGVSNLRMDVNRFLQSYIDKVVSVQLIFGDQINIAIKAQIAKISSPLNGLIAKATAKMSLPIKAAELDGFAVIEGTQLSQLHIAAGFETSGQGDEKGNKFMASLDAYRKLADDGSENCGSGGTNTFTTAISAMAPITIGESDSVSASILLQFTLGTDVTGASAYLPVGLNGGLTLEGEMKYDPFVLRDFGFVAGLGLDEVYVGAGGSGSFDTTMLGLYAFVGRTCDASVIQKVDSKIADFLSFNEGEVFTGIYGRGEVMIPVYTNGCLLSVDASATIGSWITIEPVPEVGGIIGGGAIGQLACIGSIRGELLTVASVNSRGDVFFSGKAFAVAGIGPDCDASSWTSRSRSRNDDWCGTADVGIGVKYEDEKWEYDPQAPSALH